MALCELPRDFISSDEKGGTGGTCVLRGCVPKKLMAIAGLFNEDMQDAEGYGCVTICTSTSMLALESSCVVHYVAHARHTEHMHVSSNEHMQPLTSPLSELTLFGNLGNCFGYPGCACGLIGKAAGCYHVLKGVGGSRQVHSAGGSSIASQDLISRTCRAISDES